MSLFSLKRSGVILVLFLGLTAVYLLTMPVNRTEAEDAYRYALAVEQAPAAELFDKHHLLFLPVARGLFRVAGGLGYSGRALPFLSGLSAVAAAATVGFLALLLRRRQGAPSGMAVWLAPSLLLAFSYGFWRYAAEAEVYAPALALTAAAWWLAAPESAGHARQMSGCLLAGCAVLLHAFCLVPLSALAALLLFRSRRPWVLVCLGAMVLPVAVGYCAAWPYIDAAAAGSRAQPWEGGWQWGNFLSGAMALSQSLLSGHVLLTLPGVRSILSARFPYRMLEEEFFLGEQAALWQRWVPWMTLLLTAVCAVWLAGRAFQGRARFSGRGLAGGRPAWTGWSFSPLSLAASLWLVLAAAVVLFFEPGNPEMWVMVLLPLCLCVGLWGRPVLERCGVPALCLVMCLAAHNLLGGMLWLADEKADWQARQAGKVLPLVQAGDRVLCITGPGLRRYLAYQAPGAEFREMFGAKTDAWTGQTRAARRQTGTLWVLGRGGDPMAPPLSMRYRFPGPYDRTRQAIRALSADWEIVVDGEVVLGRIGRKLRNTRNTRKGEDESGEDDGAVCVRKVGLEKRRAGKIISGQNHWGDRDIMDRFGRENAQRMSREGMREQNHDGWGGGPGKDWEETTKHAKYTKGGARWMTKE